MAQGMWEKADIVLVMDDTAVRGALKFVLEVEGLTVRLYDDLAAMLANLDLARCGCLVVDYDTPSMDGLELVEILRARDIGIPVIMITGRSDKELRHRVAKAGVRQILQMPIMDGALLDGVFSALGRADEAGDPLPS
jgi:two-component system, LuxR family, response regulator FixJ